jgi:hypothetical protein
VVLSRTRAILNNSEFKRLEEVRFTSSSHPHLGDYMRWVEDCLKPGLGNEVRVLKRKRILEEDFALARYDNLDYANVKLHWEMNQVMRELEGLNLEPSYGRVLCVSFTLSFTKPLNWQWTNFGLQRQGILYELYRISHCLPGEIPGDRVYRFRGRARNLCAKWKPLILPSYQADEYRWCYVKEGSARFRYIDGESAFSSGQELETDWARFVQIE